MTPAFHANAGKVSRRSLFLAPVRAADGKLLHEFLERSAHRCASSNPSS